MTILDYHLGRILAEVDQAVEGGNVLQAKAALTSLRSELVARQEAFDQLGREIENVEEALGEDDLPECVEILRLAYDRFPQGYSVVIG